MRPLPLLLAALLLATPRAPAQDKQDAFATSSCATACHGQQATEFAASVHARSLTCTDCHGGDPTAFRDKQGSHAAAAGFVGTPDRADIPQLCADCHSDPKQMFAYALPTDQLTHYRTSIHGQRLFGEGDTNVAVCIDCHGTHDILRSADPRAPTAPANQPATCGRCHADPEHMAPYGLPTDVVEQFVGSVHGKALLEDRARAAPACTSCHGSHGSVPPGVGDIVNVCGHCHQNTGEAFRRSPHAATDDMRCGACHADQADQAGFQRSGCAACHGAHDIAPPGEAMYTGDAVGHCGHCHRQEGEALALGREIVEGKQRLRDAMGETLREIQTAKQDGLFLENEALHLRETERTLISVRPLAHSMDEQAIQAHIADGLERQQMTQDEIGKQHRVLRDRKILTGGLALVLLMLAGLLGVKLGAVRRLS